MTGSLRRAVVTGAGGRVGQATAVELAKHGFEVAVHYNRSRDGALATVEACRAAGGDAWVVQGALDELEGCQKLCEAVKERWDHLDVLVNNASAFSPIRFEDITPEDWAFMEAINVRAPFLISQGLLPLLRARPSVTVGADGSERGVVVHLCDIGADRPVSGYAHYSVSKAGLVMLVKAMAVELAPEIRTVGVSPGQVIWPEDYPADKRARLASRIPMKRVGTPDDIAKLVRFVATEAPYLNGCVVPVDGGLSCRY